MAQVKKWKIHMVRKGPGNSIDIYVDAVNTSDARKFAELQYPDYRASTVQEVK